MIYNSTYEEKGSIFWGEGGGNPIFLDLIKTYQNSELPWVRNNKFTPHALTWFCPDLKKNALKACMTSVHNPYWETMDPASFQCEQGQEFSNQMVIREDYANLSLWRTKGRVVIRVELTESLSATMVAGRYNDVCEIHVRFCIYRILFGTQKDKIYFPKKSIFLIELHKTPPCHAPFRYSQYLSWSFRFSIHFKVSIGFQKKGQFSWNANGWTINPPPLAGELVEKKRNI